MSEETAKEPDLALSFSDIEELRKTGEALSIIMRALEGQSVDPDTMKMLLNLKNILERTRFPTFPLLQKNIYLRLVSALNPDIFASFGKWADMEAQALIAYQGKNWDAIIAMTTSRGPETSQQFFLGAPSSQKPEEHKRRWPWSRKPKDESEFKAQ